jgi:hypothetical protein
MEHPVPRSVRPAAAPSRAALTPIGTGRFLQPHSADAILFGNTFERTLNLPWGAGAALKLMKYVDPTVQQDLGAKQRPYALSPLAATMPHLVASAPDAAPAFPGTGPVGEDTAVLGLAPAPKNAEARRKHFQDAGRRQATTFGPDVRSTHLARPPGAR